MSDADGLFGTVVTSNGRGRLSKSTFSSEALATRSVGIAADRWPVDRRGGLLEVVIPDKRQRRIVDLHEVPIDAPTEVASKTLK